MKTTMRIIAGNVARIPKVISRKISMLYLLVLFKLTMIRLKLRTVLMNQRLRLRV